MTKILFSYAVNRRIIIRSYAEYLRRAYGVLTSEFTHLSMPMLPILFARNSNFKL